MLISYSDFCLFDLNFLLDWIVFCLLIKKKLYIIAVIYLFLCCKIFFFNQPILWLLIFKGNFCFHCDILNLVLIPVFQFACRALSTILIVLFMEFLSSVWPLIPLEIVTVFRVTCWCILPWWISNQFTPLI